MKSISDIYAVYEGAKEEARKARERRDRTREIDCTTVSDTLAWVLDKTGAVPLRICCIWNDNNMKETTGGDYGDNQQSASIS